MSDPIALPLWLVVVAVVLLLVCSVILIDVSRALRRQCRLNQTLLDEVRWLRGVWLVSSRTSGVEREREGTE